MALHQLGTGALGRGELAAAYDLLSGALGIRDGAGPPAAAAVTRQNLATITAAPRLPAPRRRRSAGSPRR